MTLTVDTSILSSRLLAPGLQQALLEVSYDRIRSTLPLPCTQALIPARIWGASPAEYPTPPSSP